ncbi:MAG: adenylyltransferase/cytidyltransferase family protein [Oscillospiraceae bacterium]|nr:adenylyltransferase/cytidyltransferase family protein [Oscillospiraceae bacterium]
MVKVITYGTFDLLHYGHIRLLERAKELGDYLIVGVTADDFDKTRGKINVQQPLMERVDAVRATGIADEIIIEEYEGQKIDDIKRLGVDIFTVGSDWFGKFDYLKEYCRVVYLDRTQGISSTELRSETGAVRLGFVGESNILLKYKNECAYVNGVEVSGICTDDAGLITALSGEKIRFADNYDALLDISDAVYVISHPERHYGQVKQALLRGRHVLCESPIALRETECRELFDLAKEKGLILMEAIKTAYSTAYSRLLLLLKSGRIGDVVSVDAVCTSLNGNPSGDFTRRWNSICSWGPTALLPVFQILGTNYSDKRILSRLWSTEHRFDAFSKVEFVYPGAVASVRVGTGVKSEGELVVSGTKGYALVPAPWWKTDYFEIRYENPADNRRYFYQLEGEGIRYELVSFVKSIRYGSLRSCVEEDVTLAITAVLQDYYEGKDTTILGEN